MGKKIETNEMRWQIAARRISLLASFFLPLLPCLKGYEPHGEIHLPRKTQQENSKEPDNQKRAV